MSAVDMFENIRVRAKKNILYRSIQILKINRLFFFFLLTYIRALEGDLISTKKRKK